MRTLTSAAFALCLTLSGPALAAPAHGNDHGGAEHGGSAHGEAAGHGAPALHDAEEHGGGHGDSHHYLYTADSDHDGTVNWMDADEGEHFPLASVGFHAFNLLLFAGVIGWFGRRPISDALSSRALAIRKELTDSARVRDEARQRNAELGERLDRIEAEIQGMRDKAAQDAANEEAALIARAETEAARIAETAERSVRDEVSRARFALKRDAVALAVDLAESALKERMDAQHQQRLARDFLDSIKSDGENRV
jgi:F-type H+-transporting ATPase subunit b